MAKKPKLAWAEIAATVDEIRKCHPDLFTGMAELYQQDEAVLRDFMRGKDFKSADEIREELNHGKEESS